MKWSHDRSSNDTLYNLSIFAFSSLGDCLFVKPSIWIVFELLLFQRLARMFFYNKFASKVKIKPAHLINNI